MDVLVVGDDGGGTPGFVGDRLLHHGARLREVDRSTLTTGPPDPAAADLVLLLGSPRSVIDPTHDGAVQAETGLLRAALAGGTPVIGICYGTQLAAQALGGSVRRHTLVEAGLYRVTSHDEVLCPPGPWVEMHEDTFEAPPGAVVRGCTGPTVQAFSWRGASSPGAFVGWQFHPEATVDSVRKWSARGDFVRRAGTDPDVFLTQMQAQAPRLRQAATDLTDASLAWLGVS